MSHPLSPAARSATPARSTPGNHPMAWAIAIALASSVVPASAQQAFSPAWFANKGAVQAAATQSGRLPNGAPLPGNLPAQQQNAAREKLQHSIENLGHAAQAIALQQRLQAQARLNPRAAGAVVADGLGVGGLKVDDDALTRGWLNAHGPVQSTGSDGRVQVTIEQTADKAILNWETFNIGANTTLNFAQSADWAVLNRINDPLGKPSQILGQLKAPGTVLVLNRNGVVFGSGSQVNVRNLAVAAAQMSDTQFNTSGLYSADDNSAALTDAFGAVRVEQGAQLATHAPGSATRGGGYVLLAGHEVVNAGQIEAVKGQVQLAAGDSFVIRRGVGTAQNTASTTRGNEIAPRIAQDSNAGHVRNEGLIQAREGDITLAGRRVEQAGVAVATTTVNQRGSIHLLNSRSDAQGQVLLAEGSTTAVLIEDDGKTTALNTQRDALLAESIAQDRLRALGATGTFDNLSILQDRRDQSRVEIVSGGDVVASNGALAVATGGQIVVDAAQRAHLDAGARLDVAGATGVQVAMESNNVMINVQGNELRDSPDNRDSGKLNSLANNKAWIDRRLLQHVAAGTGGYAADRWYAGGGLLEVGGYLDNQGHSIGEWAAQGGSVLLSGREVTTAAGSRINLSGGSVDVATGTIRQTWIKDSSGQRHTLDAAPANLLHAGLYRGFESDHARWGASEVFYNPILAPDSRIENGYTVGRDAGQLLLAAPTVLLQGAIDTHTFQGVRQTRAADAGLDGYAQAQTALARNAGLQLGAYNSIGRSGGAATAVHIGVAPQALQWDAQAPLDDTLHGTFWMDADTLSRQQWGRIDLASSRSIAVDGDLRLQDGGSLRLVAANVRLDGSVTAHGGTVRAGNLLEQNGIAQPLPLLGAGGAAVVLGDGARIDVSGRWSNALHSDDGGDGQAWINAGSVLLENTHDVIVGAGSQFLLDGGALLALDGGRQGGRGGSLALNADDALGPLSNRGRLQLGDGTEIRARGMAGSGTLQLTTADTVVIGDDPQAPEDALALSTALFGSGFSQYDVNGHGGVTVAADTQLIAAMPALRFADAAVSAADAASGLEHWDAPLYRIDPSDGRFVQRQGASLLLRSQRLLQGGDINVGEGALVQVDAGQSIELRGGGNISVDGALRAAGGHVALADLRDQPLPLNAFRDERTWRLGRQALIDVDGDAFSAQDASGRTLGVVRDGGSIEIGGALDWEDTYEVADWAADARIVLERGARLQASGAQGQLDVQGVGLVPVAGAGGRIVLRSAHTLQLDAQMRAAAGGDGARGGTLAIAFGGGMLSADANDAVAAPRALVLGNRRQDVATSESAPAAWGQARLDVEQVREGGFDDLSLFAPVRIDGSVSLKMAQSLRLYSPVNDVLGFRADAPTASLLDLQAPYLRLAQARWGSMQDNGRVPALAAHAASGADNRMTFGGALIDIRDTVDLSAVDSVAVRGSGDVRLLAAQKGASTNVQMQTLLAAGRELDITAAQVYAGTGARAALAAGADPTSLAGEVRWQDERGVVRVHGLPGAVPAAPHAVFGSLQLAAAQVEQGGIVRAPLGSITLGAVSMTNQPGQVRFAAGSVTSTSAAGLLVPYGGTVDGISWRFDGAEVSSGLLNISSASPRGITLKSNHTVVEAGALLDLSGGGELLGAAYVSGRGGSVDIRQHALADANPAYTFSQSGNAVYAIVPGYSASQAPVGLGDGSGDPAIGQRVIVPEGVPGLAAGSHMLLPASFALLPGAFRVELGRADTMGVAAATATGTGSWRISGQHVQGLGTTGTTSPLRTELLLTPAAQVRRHSGYNETSFNAFQTADAERRGALRNGQTVDAGTLLLSLGEGAGQDGRPALVMDGKADFAAAAGSAGFAGTVAVTAGRALEIVAAGQQASGDAHGAVIEAEALNALQPSRLILGGTLSTSAGGVTLESSLPSLLVRSGVVLRAPELLLTVSEDLVARMPGSLRVEAGAVLSTLGQGTPSHAGYAYSSRSATLALSNNALELLPPGGNSQARVHLDIGGCASTVGCQGQTQLLAGDTIAIATDGDLLMRDNAAYGARRLGLSMSAINLGSAQALESFRAQGALPAGLTLNQQVLQELLRGNTATQAPALRELNLRARDAINVFGSVELDTRNSATGHSSLDQLVLGAPAIHGYGEAGDRARIIAGNLTWAGALAVGDSVGNEMVQAPSSAMVDRLGHGQLDLVAERITLGPAPGTLVNGITVARREVLGFDALNLQASAQVTFSGKGSLDVYQAQGDYVAGQGWQYSGGAIDIQAPLLTGVAGAQLAVSTGGALRLHGAADTQGSDALGAELSLAADSILLDSHIALASGQLTARANHDLQLGGQAVLDLGGRKVTLFDVDKYTWGGDVRLSSAQGDVRTALTSRIDVSALHNRAGRITVEALGEGAGRVVLAGSLLGSATGHYAAGASVVPFDSGELLLRAQQIEDFNGLNTRLDQGGLHGTRSFQIKQGDLLLDGTLKARNIALSVDGGRLHVTGTLDASGTQVGSIRLDARDGLQVDGLLDAHGSALRVDSQGEPIDSPNRALVTLGSSQGTVALGAAARIDLRSGTAVAAAADIARGTLTLNVPRRGANDAAVDLAAGVQVAGARDILVNAVRRHDDAPLALNPDVSGGRPQQVTQGWLDTVVDPANGLWMDAALANADLSGRLAALPAARLRPGVEIVGRRSAENLHGDLVVSGDIDLSGYRYGPGADREDPARRGFGESAALVLRAEGDVAVRGSINDGFAPPPLTPDDGGWVLIEGRGNLGGATPFGGDILIPGDGVVLDRGTTFRAGTTLNYAIEFAAIHFPGGTVVPQGMEIAGNLALAAGMVLPAAVTTHDGRQFAAGSVLGEALLLQAGARLGAGFRLPASGVQMAAQTWPAGEVLPAALVLGTPLALRAGAIIPSMTSVELPGDQPVNLRPADAEGRQGANWALAPMLPEGTRSWDITVVAGADLEAADPRARAFASDGSVVLADTHYGTIRTARTESVFVGDPPVRVITEAGSLEWWGDTSFAGQPAKALADAYGMTEDAFCAEAVGVCVVLPPTLTAQGSLDWWGDESFAGRPVQELLDAGYPGMTIDDLCSSGSGYCINLPTGAWTEVTTHGSRHGTPAWSVLRTGRGDIELLAAGDVVLRSGFGVYTAGTPTHLGEASDAAFNQPRGAKPSYSAVLGPLQAYGAYDAALSAWQAWYPELGGNLSINAGRDILGDAWGSDALTAGSSSADRADHASAAVGNWLWRQGTGNAEGVSAVPASWWINFGAYSNVSPVEGSTVRMVGFTGFGTLGGGNLQLEAGRHAGVVGRMADSSAAHSTAIVAAVGSTGRVENGRLLQTGGGDLLLRSAGSLNVALAGTTGHDVASQARDLNGSFTNLRGQLRLEAAQIGGIDVLSTDYGSLGATQREPDPFASMGGSAMGGPLLVLGDASARLQSRGELVLGGASDAGRVPMANFSEIALDGGGTAAGTSWFSLWTAATSVDLIAAGGDLAPGMLGERHAASRNLPAETAQLAGDTVQLDLWLYPSRLRMLAASGNIKLERAYGNQRQNAQNVLLTAPSASGELQVLAMQNILAQPGSAWLSSASGDTRLPTPFDPAFIGQNAISQTIVGNVGASSFQASPSASLPLFAFGDNTPVNRDLRAGGGSITRFYAVQGDVIGLRSGATWALSPGQLVEGQPRGAVTLHDVAAPVQLRAGRDVLGVQIHALNNTAQDISVVQAGRDIVHAQVQVSGPGNLEVSAGRQIRQEDQASITTLGGLLQGDTRPGASIAVTAGNQQLDYTALRARYLDPANLADAGLPLADQPGKAVKLYGEELSQWLADRFGQQATGDAALALFDALPGEQQRLFLREVFQAELREAGREYNDADGARFGSYLRGREAIATLAPDRDAAGALIDRPGDLVFFGPSGIRTEAGGSIDLLVPGGQVVVGVQGEVPPASAGVVTQGNGDIRIFSEGSLLLGLSRVMTTFGGSIQAWSEAGDINAGRGALTSVQYTPPRRVYDQWGNVTLSPQAPASGAGIATLAPIAEVPAGDVDLIAPLGTIDAGEAGIRVSGNVNLAALQVLNAANIQVQGDSAGLPVVASINVNALASASAAANSATQAAQDVVRGAQDAARRNQPSVISVQVLGFGATSGLLPEGKGADQAGYDAQSAFQFPQAPR